MADLNDTLGTTNTQLNNLTVELSAFKDKTDIQSALIAKLFDPDGKLADFERKSLTRSNEEKIMAEITDSLEKLDGGVKALTVELSAFKDKTGVQSACSRR